MPVKLTIGQHYIKASFPYWKLLSLLCLMSAVMISMALNKNAYVASQKDIFSFSNNALQILPSEIWHNITYLGDALILIPLLSFICLVNTRMWAAMFGAIPLACSLSHFGKNYFAIPRPAAVLDHQQFTIIGDALTAHTSFPSGHTITIFTAVSAVVFVLLREAKINNQHLTCWVYLSIAVATLVAISRVAVGAHWPADLAFGAIIGTVSGLSGEYLSRHYSKWWYWAKVKPAILGCFILTFCFALLVCTITGKLPELTVIWLAISVSAIVGSYITLRSIFQNEH